MPTPSLTRRHFLRGAGLSLLLPVLPSLLPRTARAQAATKPVRYLQVLDPYSPTWQGFYGGLTATQRVSPHVNVAPLMGAPSSLSPILGTSFNALRAKVSVLRGLDVLSYSQNHNYCFPTTATGYRSGDNDEFPPDTGQESIDVVLSKSAKVYPQGASATRRLVQLNPLTTDGYSGNKTFSWSRGTGGLAMLRPTKQTQAVFDTFASGFSTGAPAPAPDDGERELVQAVYGDYRRLRDSGRLSSEDQQRLEAYLSLVRDIERELPSPTVPAPTCSSPTREAEANADATVRNQLRILAAAMACDLTRVASVVLGASAGYDARHPQHHFQGSNAALTADFTRNAGRVAQLCTFLEGLTDAGGGTLLDNSVVYWAHQYGCCIGPDSHANWDMAVLLAGGAGGRLRQGHYVDYRVEGSGGDRRPGVPLNNLLVTLFNALGLGSSDYETQAGAGYGQYNPNPPAGAAFGSRPNAAFWGSTEGKRSPLPHLYVGPKLG